MPGTTISKGVHRVYLVDGHPLVVDWLTDAIGRQPDLMVCGASESASDAMKAIEQLRPDLVVAEINFRGSCGMSLVKEIRRQTPATSVLVFSMHADPIYAERALRAGAHGYVMKREPTRCVISAIKDVLNGKTRFSEEFNATLMERMLRQNGVGSDVAQFSDRELEVFRRLGTGRTTRVIADELGLSIKTIQVFCGRMKRKLGISSGAQLVRRAMLWVESVS
jgi:DNA-binding NarL/FixJ family response regulator